MVSVIASYMLGLEDFAKQMLIQGDPAKFPTPPLSDADPISEYIKAVSSSIAFRKTQLKPITVGSSIAYMIVVGGISDQAGGTVADMWIFDTNTMLWQIPVRVRR
jgi:hypothetical protein